MYCLAYRNAKALLGNLERQSSVATTVRLVKAVIVDKLWTVAVDKSTKGQTVRKALLKVLDIDVRVRCRLALTP